ncbi:cytochrome c-type biogenesis protein CcmF [Candidatus Frackibacter sp. WG11]|uniref:heme lyase CcmF/NrfE family subunit n=1 Tax=Candidatus Frackibacter sp. WG11 TaxID=2017976 RepID=UPI00088E0B0B|nr:heme lyase CcmF/NrfE family subunit [Candidatus Frackibacter sp. WG11]SDC40170.1 cytochrome c-type biogenesis protein CcmF [Candidatus Frackibacter sp. WG11]
MAEVGSIALLISLVVTIYSIVAYILGLKQKNKRLLKSAENGVFANAILTTVASAALLYALVTSDFSIKYVAHYTNFALPLAYKISAFWAGNSGSLLLWYWVLSIYAAIIASSKKPEGAQMRPYASAVLMFISLFFALVLNFEASPFAQLGFTPQDGQGLNPMLQNVGMVIHPVTTYLGYVGFAVPFAFAMAALYLKKTGATWIKLTRRWTLIAWLFLSIGIVSGGQWAYVELGWGGYWAWDPVENASLLPWLTSTAFFHSVMIQERKGMLKIWNVLLIIITFALTLFGTFLTRSGILSSVHAFGESQIGLYFLIFMGVILAGSLNLFAIRRKSLESENEFESTLSKESSFLFNNLLLVGSAFAVFWGTIYPIISEAVRGVKVTVGPPFFNQVNVPIGILLVILTGICPLIAWRKSSWQNFRKNFLAPLVLSIIFAAGIYITMGVNEIYPLLALTSSFFVFLTIIMEFYRGVKARMKMKDEGLMTALFRLVSRNRRRYGGYIVHLAVVIMIIGITGSSAYKLEREVTVNQGEVIHFEEYDITYHGLKVQKDPNKDTVYANLSVKKNGKPYTTLRPAKQYFKTWEEPVTEVDFKSGIEEDLYIILAGWSDSGAQAILKVVINPLVSWLFFGINILIVGTLIAVWPDDRQRSIELLKEMHKDA